VLWVLVSYLERVSSVALTVQLPSRRGDDSGHRVDRKQTLCVPSGYLVANIRKGIAIARLKGHELVRH